MFEIITVVVVLSILGVFAIGAYKAEKVVAAKAKLGREAKTETGSTKKKK